MGISSSSNQRSEVSALASINTYVYYLLEDIVKITKIHVQNNEERSGSVLECLTRDPKDAG